MQPTLVYEDYVKPSFSSSSFSAVTLLVGSLTRKIVSEMTYNVSSGTLNPTIPYFFYFFLYCSLLSCYVLQ